MTTIESGRRAMQEVAIFDRSGREFVEVSGEGLVDIPTAVYDYIYVMRFSLTRLEGFYVLRRTEFHAYLNGSKGVVRTRFVCTL